MYTGHSKDSPLLKRIRGSFIPNRVLIHIDPFNPPRGLAQMNASLRSLVEELEAKGSGGAVKENVRICENFTCGLPIEDVAELEEKLPSAVP